MSEFAESELDRGTALAWSAFRGRLADHVAAMQDDEVALVEAETTVEEGAGDEGAAPYVQFCAWGEDLVRCELTSNAYLAAAHPLDEDQVAALVELGWNPPTHGPEEEAGSGSTNFYLDAEAPGSVTPEMAAAVCDLDRELILGLVTWSNERERTWDLTREELLAEGDPEGLADVCLSLIHI